MNKMKVKTLLLLLTFAWVIGSLIMANFFLFYWGQLVCYAYLFSIALPTGLALIMVVDDTMKRW